MDEKMYEEILTEAGMDFETIQSGERLSREIAGGDNAQYEDLLLEDALDCLNHIIPQVQDLYFRKEVVDAMDADGVQRSKPVIVVECSETGREEIYRSGTITDMLDELEEIKEENQDDYDLDY